MCIRDRTINNVASGFNRMGVVGYVASDDNLLASVNVTLRLAAGSPSIYMKNVVVKINYGSVDKTLQWAAAADATHFSAAMKFEVTSGLFATDFTVKQGDMLALQIGCLASNLDIDNLQDLEIQIIPGFGQATIIDVTTPEVFLGTYVNLS